jgi:hypothetical protein
MKKMVAGFCLIQKEWLGFQGIRNAQTRGTIFAHSSPKS